MFEEPFRLDMLDNPNRKLIIHCPDGELAEELIQLLYQHNIRWYSGDSDGCTMWDVYEENTCYFVEGNGTFVYGNLDYTYSEKDALKEYITCIYQGADPCQDFEPAGVDELQHFLMN